MTGKIHLPTRITAASVKPTEATRKPPETELTRRQYLVWEWMISFQRTHCMPPSIREVCDRFEFSSTQAAVSHFRALIKKGKMLRIGKVGSSRSYLAVFPDDRCPCCGRKPLGESEYARHLNQPDPGPLPPAEVDPEVVYESGPSYREMMQRRMREADRPKG